MPDVPLREITTLEEAVFRHTAPRSLNTVEKRHPRMLRLTTAQR
jgi:hypothetical protein